MTRFPRSWWSIVLALLLAAPAFANDTTARVAAGGLVFTKSDDIRMVSEKLSISTSRITVDYVFRNESSTTIDTTVAFPMPPYGLNCGHSAGEANVRPLDSFRITADDQPVTPSRLRQAEVNGKEATAALRQIGLTEEQIFVTFGHDCDAGHYVTKLSSRQQGSLRKLGAMVDGIPRWTVAETAHWRQIFPALREVRIRHEYKPFVGYAGSSDLSVVPDSIPVSTSEDYHRDRACVGEGGLRAIRKRAMQDLPHGASPGVALHDVEYILGTGRNWKGPIGAFTLDIVKGTPDQIVSLCFPGKPTRVDALTLRFQQRDLTPPDRLHVNFYTFWR
jgi:hypothetical protein